MSTIVTVGVPAHTLLKLARHFEEKGDEADLGKVIGEIVEAWLADRGRAAALAEAYSMEEGRIPRG